ncbi:MAG TPA: hypothetical protein VK595_10825 [Vicinamibacterales bacterium]|nr:hypothetical protein [Vicinamibacterales bacterium]
MTDEKVYIQPDQCVCIIPRELAENPEVTLCAGVKFVRLDEDQCELVLLTEQDVERLTDPEAS